MAEMEQRDPRTSSEVFDDFEPLRGAEAEERESASSEDQLEPFGRSAQLSERTLESVQTEAEVGEAQPTDGAPEKESPAKPDRRYRQQMQARINSLFRQGKEKEEALEAERRKVSDLETRLVELERRSQVPLPTQMSPWVQNPLVGFDAAAAANAEQYQAQQQNQGFDPRFVASVVQQAIRPIAQEIAERRQADAIADAQERAWGELAADYPEIDQPGSDLRRTAEEILNRDATFRANPEGPKYATLIARGLLSEQMPNRRERTKRQASTVGPAVGGEESRRMVAIQKEIVAIRNKPDADARDIMKLSALKRQLLELQGRGTV